MVSQPLLAVTVAGDCPGQCQVFSSILGFPDGSAIKNLVAKQETGFNPWVGKIPWRRAWQFTSVFLPGKSHGQRSLVATVHGVAKSQTRVSDYTTNNQASWPHGITKQWGLEK